MSIFVQLLQGGFIEWKQDVRILIVDDEERIRRLLKMYLERENYIIDEAEEGNEALRKGIRKGL